MALLNITYAPEAWKLLNGVLCVYKPAGSSYNQCIRVLKEKLCEDLNSMKTRPAQTIVQMRKRLASAEFPNEPGKEIVATIPDGNEVIEVVKLPSLADHPNVIGPRYQPQDIRYYFPNKLGFRTSGVTLLGLTGAIKTSQRIFHSQWVRTFIVSGKFGIATTSAWNDGPIQEKSTYHKIGRHMLERILSSIQASHQRLMFQTAGVLLDSERAYELASKGYVRPEPHTTPIIYSLKVVSFDLPHFEIEVKAINETQEYLAGFIHELGLKLHSVASCTQIRCIQYGPFGLTHALLTKHWQLENVIENIQHNKQILKDFDLTMRDPLVRIAASGTEPKEPPAEFADVESVTPAEIEVQTYDYNKVFDDNSNNDYKLYDQSSTNS